MKLLLGALGLSFSISGIAATKDLIGLMDLKKIKNVTVTLEQDLVLPPGESEIYFANGRPASARFFEKSVPPVHCKVILQGADKAPRRVSAAAKTAMPVRDVTYPVWERNIITVRLDLNSKTIKSVECADTTAGKAFSTLPHANEPTNENFAWHFGSYLSLRSDGAVAETVVNP